MSSACGSPRRGCWRAGWHRGNPDRVFPLRLSAEASASRLGRVGWGVGCGGWARGLGWLSRPRCSRATRAEEGEGVSARCELTHPELSTLPLRRKQSVCEVTPPA